MVSPIAECVSLSRTDSIWILSNKHMKLKAVVNPQKATLVENTPISSYLLQVINGNYKKNVWNLFKINNKETRTTLSTSF